MGVFAGPLAVGQLAIPVANLERALVFYRDVLGLQFLFQAPPGLAFLKCGEVRIMLAQKQQGEPGTPAGVIYYRVADLDAAYSALRSRRATFVDEPHLIARLPDHELWMVFLRDPDDHLLALMAERPLSPADSTSL
ncbi:MAG TPA: VOC family protein [Gemmatimonadales bacterium]|nr:VOC family protein [Gemmatimonadales bacterium]